MQRRSEQLIASLGMGLKTGLTLPHMKHGIAEPAAVVAPCLKDSSETPPPDPRSLKTRAVYYLSKREYSRAELAKKLAQPTYKARQKAFVHKMPLPETPSPAIIEVVLDDLERQGFLNDIRFAQALARQSAKKHGVARVMFNLKPHQLDASTTQQLAIQLKSTELPRCYEAWVKRFAHINRTHMDFKDSQTALGKQGRFLMQRGFSNESVKKVLNGWQPESTSI